MSEIESRSPVTEPLNQLGEQFDAWYSDQSREAARLLVAGKFRESDWLLRRINQRLPERADEWARESTNPFIMADLQHEPASVQGSFQIGVAVEFGINVLKEGLIAIRRRISN